MTAFDYDQAFARNIGWVTRAEQASLRGKRVAIAGLGGVGGSHLLALARLGVGAFNIADFDTFETANRNRQAGSFESTLDRPKVEVLAAMARGASCRPRRWRRWPCSTGNIRRRCWWRAPPMSACG